MTGCLISAMFGALWSIGAASVLLRWSVAAGVVVVAVGLVVGVGTAVAALRVRRHLSASSAASAAEDQSSAPGMFASRGYRIAVAAEVVAIFGRLFAARFYLVGAVLIIGALVGLLLALLTAPMVGQLVTPSVGAVDLLVAGLVPVVAASRSRG